MRSLLFENSYSFIPATTVIQPHWQAGLATISLNSLSLVEKEVEDWPEVL
jgi:hypothetical protein